MLVLLAKILPGEYILNLSMQTAKTRAMKGQKHPGNTSRCTSLTPLPISAWLSLEA